MSASFGEDPLNRSAGSGNRLLGCRRSSAPAFRFVGTQSGDAVCAMQR